MFDKYVKDNVIIVPIDKDYETENARQRDFLERTVWIHFIPYQLFVAQYPCNQYGNFFITIFILINHLHKGSRTDVIEWKYRILCILS